MSSRARSSSSPWGAGPDQTRRSEPLTQRCFRTGDSSTTGAGDGDGDRLAALDATQYLADLIAKFLLRDDRHPPMAAVLLPPRFNGFCRRPPVAPAGGRSDPSVPLATADRGLRTRRLPWHPWPTTPGP